MLVLRNSAQEDLVNLRIADSFWTRAVGLLGSSSLEDQQGLWIKRCNSIHTFFMKYAIDCVFLDKTMKVIEVKKEISPWKMTWPVWQASTVIELAAGVAEKKNIRLGDQLYVGS